MKCAEWISVEDMLPGYDEKYKLVLFDKKYIHIAKYLKGSSSWFLIPDSPGGGISYSITDYKVTHWMPLPELPEDDE